MALLGDAANHVYSLHGSGVGLSIIAAHLMAETLTGERDPGDPALLHRYQARFLRRYGGRLAACDMLRRASQRMSTEAARSGFQTSVRSGAFGGTTPRASAAWWSSGSPGRSRSAGPSCSQSRVWPRR